MYVIDFKKINGIYEKNYNDGGFDGGGGGIIFQIIKWLYS